MNDTPEVSAVAEALIRQYFQLHGFRVSLQCLDKVASEAYSTDLKNLHSKKLGNLGDCHCPLQSMVHSALNASTSSTKQLSKKTQKTSKCVIWTAEQIEALQAGLERYPSTMEKSIRFTKIADSIDGNFTKKQCYAKFKEISKENPLHKPNKNSKNIKKTNSNSSKDSPVKKHGGWSTGKFIKEPHQVAKDDKDESNGEISVVTETNDKKLFGRRDILKTNLKRRNSSFEEVHEASYSDNDENDTRKELKGNDGEGVNDEEDKFLARRGTEMNFEDIEDDFDAYENDLHANMYNTPTIDATGEKWQNNSIIPKATQVKPSAITLESATQLRTLFFGNAKSKFPDPWLQQGLFFSKDIKYGLVQLQGGPCGPLASLQANILKHLFDYTKNSVDQPKNRTSDFTLKSMSKNGTNTKWDEISNESQEAALHNAIVDILWYVGGNEKAILVTEDGGAEFGFGISPMYKPDGITENLQLYHCCTKNELWQLLDTDRVMSQFTEEKGHGVLLFIYSVVFSKGLSAVRKDMDTLLGSGCKLMGNHELVNLILTGGAYSHVFDGEKQIEGEKPGSTISLNGIPSKSSIGFLTLFEHYDNVNVGSNLKQPKLPIWVVQSESHYSVLFSPPFQKMPAENSEKFDLFYYDELARQTDTIRLTISSVSDKSVHKKSKDPEDENDLIPPLNKVIRTKWKCVSVDWNGTEELL